MSSFYIAPGMTTEAVVEMIVSDMSLKPGIMVGPEEKGSAPTGKAQSSVYRYTFSEVKEFSNGVTENRRLAEKEFPLKLRVEAQPLLQSRALYHHFFELSCPSTWITRMNTQANRIKDKIRTSAPLLPSAPAPLAPSDTMMSPSKQRPDQDDAACEYMAQELAQMPDPEFDAVFSTLLVDLNIKNPEVHKAMTAFPKERKITLLVQNSKHQKASNLAMSSAAPPNPEEGAQERSNNLWASLLGRREQSEKSSEFFIEKLNSR